MGLYDDDRIIIIITIMIVHFVVDSAWLLGLGFGVWGALSTNPEAPICLFDSCVCVCLLRISPVGRLVRPNRM